MSNINISMNSQVYIIIYVSQILHFETQVGLRFVPVASAAVHVLLRRAQFVYADRTVLIMLDLDQQSTKHKYART